jgi:uncharacterized membrane protein HdeD (DUF308 family)
MDSMLLANNLHLSAFKKNWKWFLLWGVVLVILGALAINAAVFTTAISIVFLGTLIFLSGIIIIIDTFTFWWRRWRGFFLHAIMGALYLAVGTVLIDQPILASVSLTLLLGIFYILLGISRLTYSMVVRLPRCGWHFFNGLISLLLGILILISWPTSGLYIIGLFIGIDLLICGCAYIMASLYGQAAK